MGHDRCEIYRETRFYLTLNLEIEHKTYPPAQAHRIKANSVVVDLGRARRAAQFVETRRQSFHFFSEIGQLQNENFHSCRRGKLQIYEFKSVFTRKLLHDT